MPPDTNAYVYPMYDVLLTFGDSMTQYGGDPQTGGYVAYLSEQYQRQMDVLNRGFSGYNTTVARQIIHSVLPKSPFYMLEPSPNTTDTTSNTTSSTSANININTNTIWPDRDDTFPNQTGTLRICIFFFGANDASNETWHQHTPLDAYGDNLQYFASLLQSPSSEHYSPDTNIIFITPPPVNERMVEASARAGNLPAVFTNESARKYADMVKTVAERVNAPYVDLNARIEQMVANVRAQLQYNNTNGFEGYDQYLIDGVHLNELGNRLLFTMIMQAIESNWPELSPSKPP
ncbi:isoamyl acetate-hydrolyzing esterase [Coemansia sp. RSA 1972]|nr:isoamyl acetate-hydrolyzing esterase [Coemansia sp. RSA 1972]